MKKKTTNEELAATQISLVQLKKEVQTLKEENMNLEKDKTTLEYEIAWLELKNKDSQSMIARFMKSNQAFSDKIKNLNSDIDSLQKRMEKVCELGDRDATIRAINLLNLVGAGLR